MSGTIHATAIVAPDARLGEGVEIGAYAVVGPGVEVGPRTRIGALVENDVAVPAPSVSRVHAEIRAEGKGFTLVDLGSTNGTRVNGSRIEMARLRPGDRVKLGEVELVFES